MLYNKDGENYPLENSPHTAVKGNGKKVAKRADMSAFEDKLDELTTANNSLVQLTDVLSIQYQQRMERLEEKNAELFGLLQDLVSKVKTTTLKPISIQERTILRVADREADLTIMDKFLNRVGLDTHAIKGTAERLAAKVEEGGYHSQLAKIEREARYAGRQELADKAVEARISAIAAALDK